MERDAQLVGQVPSGVRRIRPRSSLVWIRLAGVWRRGEVLTWLVDDDRWYVWLRHERVWPDREPRTGLYAYDPAAMHTRRS